jgi:hypothetical protein
MKSIWMWEIFGSGFYILLVLGYLSYGHPKDEEIEGYAHAIILAIVLLCNCLISLLKI